MRNMTGRIHAQMINMMRQQLPRLIVNARYVASWRQFAGNFHGEMANMIMITAVFCARPFITTHRDWRGLTVHVT